MSYHARIRMPLLIVTAITGACGKMKRTASDCGRFSAGTTSDHPLPSSPNPCIQMTDASGLAPVSIVIASSSSDGMARRANQSSILSEALHRRALRLQHAALRIALCVALGPIRVTVRWVRTGLDAHVIDATGVAVASFAAVQRRDVLLAAESDVEAYAEAKDRGRGHVERRARVVVHHDFPSTTPFTERVMPQFESVRTRTQREAVAHYRPAVAAVIDEGERAAAREQCHAG